VLPQSSDKHFIQPPLQQLEKASYAEKHPFIEEVIKYGEMVQVRRCSGLQDARESVAMKCCHCSQLRQWVAGAAAVTAAAPSLKAPCCSLEHKKCASSSADAKVQHHAIYESACQCSCCRKR
jgi:hypothetical protein